MDQNTDHHSEKAKETNLCPERLKESSSMDIVEEKDCQQIHSPKSNPGSSEQSHGCEIEEMERESEEKKRRSERDKRRWSQIRDRSREIKAQQERDRRLKNSKDPSRLERMRAARLEVEIASKGKSNVLDVSRDSVRNSVVEAKICSPGSDNSSAEDVATTNLVEERTRSKANKMRLKRAQSTVEARAKEAQRGRKRRRIVLENTEKDTSVEREETIRKRGRAQLEKERRTRSKLAALENDRILHHTAWRKINQYEPSTCEYEENAILQVSKEYKADLKEFQERISCPLKRKVCSICGLRTEIDACYPDNDPIFDCLRDVPKPDASGPGTTIDLLWWKFPNPEWDNVPPHTVAVCAICRSSLSKYIVPLRSRACYPIKFTRLPAFLSDLSDLEQALISPVLPMIMIYQHYGTSGQFKSYGQSIALQNDVETIAKVLPRRPEEICLKLSDRKGTLHKVRPHIVRRALEVLKENGHPGFIDITFSEENFNHLCYQIEEDKLDCASEAMNESPPASERNHLGDETEDVDHSNRMQTERSDDSAANRLLNAGQNQKVENETAQECAKVPIGVEPLHYTKVLREAAFELMSRSSVKEIHHSHITENWELKFPLLLPEGTGGPDACTDPNRKLSVEEWVKYVVQVEDLDFSTNILFVLYSNNVVRRRKITGIACNKTISQGVRQAMEELYVILQQNTVPGKMEHHLAAVQMLLNRISYHTNDITGSVQDKSLHRQNILSMYNDDRHGGPQLFVTLSAAESFWPETFVFISNGRLTLEEARELDKDQRAQMIAKNPTRVTIAWKERVAAFIDLITNGKSKPLGNIRHYIWTAEWQTRLSEHIHLILWSDIKLPELHTEVDGEGNIRLGNNSGLVHDVERFVCMQIPGERSSSKRSINGLTPHKAITTDRIEDVHLLLNKDGGSELRTRMRNLILACNIHSCNNYCTRNGKTSCKSGFPHRTRETGSIIESVDAKQNKHYRAQLKRNDTQVNSYNVPIMNAWRANMDISALLGDAFGACVYVAYYTSKKDKSADLHKVINKIKNMELPGTEQELKRNLNRILLAIDSCKATGAPEASSNILGYKHHFTSTRVQRILQKSFIVEAEKLLASNDDTRLPSSPTEALDGVESPRAEELEHRESLNKISDTVCQIAGDHPLFDIQNAKPGDGDSEEESFNIPDNSDHNKITRQYLLRPLELEALSQQDYYQSYYVHPRPRRKDAVRKLRKSQLLDRSNRIVEKRKDTLGCHVILDLKYRPSPNTEDEQWCAGALLLHASYRSVKDLLRPRGNSSLKENASFCVAYKFWAGLKNEDGSLAFPKLRIYERNMKSLEATTKNTGRPRTRQEQHSNERQSNTDVEQPADSMHNDDEDEDELIQEYLDMEEEVTSTLPSYSNAKLWTGTPSLKYAVFGTDHDESETYAPQSHSDLSSSIADSKEFTNAIYKKIHPPEQTVPIEEEDSFRDSIANGTPRNVVADRYRNRIGSKCRTATQEHTFKKATTALENYYFQPDSPQVMVITGVAGSGKSFVSNKFATFASLLLRDNDYPYDSSEATLQRESMNLDSSFSRTVADLNSAENGTTTTNGTSGGGDNRGTFQGHAFKKRVHTVAYSGAAAGVAGGYTIHHALGLTRTQLSSSDVARGITDLPLYQNTALDIFWQDIKAIVIDEVYFCDAAFLNIIHQRLCQIKKTHDKQFGGLFVLLIGDPQQIKALRGEPLYKYNYFYPAQGNAQELVEAKNERRVAELSSSPGATKGFQLYGSCNLYCHMPESQRLADADFQRLTLRAASYELTKEDIAELNTYAKPKSELFSEKWLDAVWILPTWDEINRHHSHITSFMAKKRGILRVWSRPMFNTEGLSRKRMSQILHFYYTTTSTDISRDFTEPLPYMDIFPGQILCLKENYVPSLNFYKNARVVVVGVHFHDNNREIPPMASAEEAIAFALHPDGPPAYDILVRFYSVDSDKQFKGVSALTATTGVFALPWTRVEKKIGGASLTIHGVRAHPGNAGTGHGSQGATFPRAVASVSKSTTMWYGWANVAISRTRASNFALHYPVSLDIMLAQKGQAAVVRSELNRLSYLDTPRDEVERNWARKRSIESIGDI